MTRQYAYSIAIAVLRGDTRFDDKDKAEAADRLEELASARHIGGQVCPDTLLQNLQTTSYRQRFSNWVPAKGRKELEVK